MDSHRASDNEIVDGTAGAEDKFATTRESAESRAPMALLLKSAGSQTIPFGRYELLRVLGEGSMGSVYLARDTQLQRQVAIKVPKLDEGDRADLQRFHREARTLATLRHPHLCPVFDVGEVGGIHFFTMAYIEGGTLADYLSAGEALPDRQVARLIAKTASALDAAHQAGIVHRDLKPANIMIDRNKEPVVMDFGLASVADANASLTQWGEMLGTPAYMAPEQIRGDLDLVGPASDVYSLGAIMYQMLTGNIPFDGSVATVVRKALDSEPAELASLTNHVDAELSAICRKAMSKEPRERFASAADMANALRDFLLGKNQAKRPMPAAADPAPSTVTALLDQHAARVRELWGEARYADALPLLEQLARRTDPPAARYAAWAREEIPKIREKITQTARAGDWLSAANFTTHTHLGPPVRSSRSGTDDSLPPWLLWAMAAPTAVIVFLIVLVIATRWNDSTTDRATITTNSADDPPTARDGSYPPNPSPPNPPQHNDPEFRGPEPPERNGPPPRRPPPRDAAGLLRDLDVNQDGQLAFDEIPPHHRPHLMRADTDGDTILSRAELEAFQQRPAPPPAPR